MNFSVPTEKGEELTKVIKPGKKEFIGNCSRCGCEFSYTLEELKAQYPLKFLRCPECGDEYHHPDQSNNSDETPVDYPFEKQINDLLDVFKQFSKEKHTIGSDSSSTITSTSYCCPVCGGNMVVDDSIVLTTNPPQYWWRCQKCGHAESHFCNGVTITNNSICGPRVIYCSESFEKEE